jgi:hypothetical protein
VKPLDLGTSGFSVVIFANAQPWGKGRRLHDAVNAGGAAKSREETPKEGSGNAQVRDRTPYANTKARHVSVAGLQVSALGTLPNLLKHQICFDGPIRSGVP